MKKLLVVFAAITLVFGIAVTAMAADASFSGDWNFGFATVFDHEQDMVGWGDLELDFEFMWDDYNTLTIATDFSPGTFMIDETKLDTDLGAFFELPIGLVHSAGWFEPGGESYPDETTGWEFEDQTKDSIGEAATAIGLEANYDDMVIIDVAFSVAQFNQRTDPLAVAAEPSYVDEVTGEGAWDAYFGVAAPDIADLVSAEVYYAIQNSSEFKGFFGIDAQTAQIAEMVTAGLSFTYSTQDDADTEKVWDWIYGVGASAEVSLATVGVSLRGNSEDTLDLLGIDCNLELTDVFGADAGVALGFFDGAETLQCADISVSAKVGEATVRLGYLITDATKAVVEDGAKYKAPTLLMDPDNFGFAGKGGLYFNVGAEF
jgi:hypothetical protein